MFLSFSRAFKKQQAAQDEFLKRVAEREERPFEPEHEKVGERSSRRAHEERSVHEQIAIKRWLEQRPERETR